MIYVVRLEGIPCEVCGRKLKHVICFWFFTKGDEEDFLETGDKELVGEYIGPDSLLGKTFPGLVGKRVGYIAHGKPKKEGEKGYEPCQMSKKAPRNEIIIGTLLEAIKKEMVNPIRRPDEGEPAEFRQAGHCPQRKKKEGPPAPSIVPFRKIV